MGPSRSYGVPWPRPPAAPWPDRRSSGSFFESSSNPKAVDSTTKPPRVFTGTAVATLSPTCFTGIYILGRERIAIDHDQVHKVGNLDKLGTCILYSWEHWTLADNFNFSVQTVRRSTESLQTSPKSLSGHIQKPKRRFALPPIMASNALPSSSGTVQ
jgi:hypothetical protein